MYQEKKLAQVDLHQWEIKIDVENIWGSKNQIATLMVQMLQSSPNHLEEIHFIGAQHLWCNSFI